MLKARSWWIPFYSRERRHLWRLLGSAGWWAVAALTTVLLLTSIVPALMALATGALVAGVAHVANGADALSSVGWPLTAVAALLAYELVSNGFVQPARDWIGFRVNGRVRQQVRAALVDPSGIEHLEDQFVRDLAALPVDDQGLAIGAGAQGQLWLVMRFVGAFASVALVANWSWPMALFEFGLLVWCRRLLLRLYARNLAGKLAGIAPQLRAAEYWKDVAGSPIGAKETRMFGLVEHAVQQYAVNARAMVDLTTSVLRPAIGKSWVFGVVPAIAVGVPLVFATRDAIAGDLAIGQYAVVVGALTGMLQIGFMGYEAFDIGAAVAQLGALRDLKIATDPPSAPSRLPASVGRVPAIRFERVSFRYPGATEHVLRELNLDIASGQSLAIVGENGVGKTTLIKLLAGFYQPTAGRIIVDGVDLADLDAAEWRTHLAVIFQSFARFHLSARDNVALAALEHPDRGAHARAAASAAGALELIESLPAGWDTTLSRDYTGGVELSGGQWQRIALARALYAARVGAGVLVLDEPTANLDVHAEVALFDQVLTHAEGLTAIVISHRYSTVRRAERIVVIDGGRVIEDGDHEKLVASGGTYARLYGLQAAAFLSAERSSQADGGAAPTTGAG